MKARPLSAILAAFLSVHLPCANVSVGAAADAAGTFTITGRCLDECRQPLADVSAVLYRVSSWPTYRCARIQESLTDAGGRYRFANVAYPAPRNEVHEGYTTLFTKRGMASQITPVRSKGKDEAQEVTMFAPSTVSGRVTDPEGKPVIGAIVYTRGPSNLPLEGFMSATTDADGRFSILDFYPFAEETAKKLGARFGGKTIGRHPLRIHHPEFAQQVVLFQGVPEPFDIALEWGGAVEGRVIDAVTGRPVRNVAVIARSTRRDAGDNLHETETDELGNYRMTGVRTGTYSIWARAEDRTCVAVQPVQVVSKQTQQVADVQLIAGGWIEGRVLDLYGQPVTRDPQTGDRLTVCVWSRARLADNRDSESCAVDDDGSFRIRVPPGRNYPLISSSGQEVWNRTWRKEKFEKGVDMDDGETIQIKFRVLEKLQAQ